MPRTVVAVEQIGLPLEVVWMRIADRCLAAVAFVAGHIGHLVGAGRGRIVGHVVGDIEVEIAVAVVIGKGATRAPARIGDAGLPANFGKVSVVVAKECVGAKVGQVEIEVAVAIVVGRGNPHADSWVGDPGRDRDKTLAIVAKKAIDRGRSLRIGGDKSAVYGVNIQIAIAVVVEEGTPAAHSFGEVALRAAAVFVLPCQADGRRYFDKAERRGCGRGVQRRCRWCGLLGGVTGQTEQADETN